MKLVFYSKPCDINRNRNLLSINGKNETKKCLAMNKDHNKKDNKVKVGTVYNSCILAC